MNPKYIAIFDASYVDDAIRLISAYYELEKKVVLELPSFNEYQILLKKNLKNLAEKGLGHVIVENDSVIGFIVGYPVKELFGREQGIFVPVFAHAAVLSRRMEIEEELYIIAAEKWVEQKIFTHTIAVFAHDKELQELWF